jgi:hypothetical protein
VESVVVRRFERGDREQVTALANAHIAAVVPNVSVSVQGLLSQLEREPGEFIVDPWVTERVALVAEQRTTPPSRRRGIGRSSPRPGSSS